MTHQTSPPIAALKQLLPILPPKHHACKFFSAHKLCCLLMELDRAGDFVERDLIFNAVCAPIFGKEFLPDKAVNQ